MTTPPTPHAVARGQLRVDPDFEALGHFAFEWQAGHGWRASAGGRALLGLPDAPAFVDDDTWWAQVHPADRAETRQLTAAMRDGAAEHCQCNFRVLGARPDGDRWVLIRSRVAARDGSGRLLRLSGTLTEVDEIERAALAARQREIRLNEALEHSGIAWYERDGTIIRGSPTLAEIYDLDSPHGPWDQSDIFGHLAPMERARHRQDVRSALAADDVLSATHVTGYRVTHRDGSIRDVEIRYRIVDDAEPLRTYGLIFDVTATKALEAKFQDAMEHAGVAWFERDIITGALAGSRSLWHLYGFDPTDHPLTLDKAKARVHPDDWPAHPAWTDTLLETSRAVTAAGTRGPSSTVRYRVRRDDGGWRWLEVRFRTVFDGRGGGTVSGLVVDVTEAQQAEDALRAGRARLLLALEAARMATWDWDPEHDLIRSSDVLAELYGLPDAGPWPLACFLERIHPDDREQVMQEITAMLAEPDDHLLSTEFRLQRAPGDERWFEARARKSADGVLGVSTDVTARKQAEAGAEQLRRQLQQAQKMEAIGQLTGGIAHDFNNILAGILGYGDLALKRFGDTMPERLASYLHEMQAGGRRARDLVRHLLAFSRAEPAELQPVALGTVTEQTIDMLRPTLPASLTIDFTVAAHLPPVMADPVQSQQVVMNLCINARDALNGEGHVTISMERRRVASAHCASCQNTFDGDYVVLSVGDDGPGIERQDQARIFEPFYTSKAPGEGTGMGLSIVHGIVHQHGGHLLVDSAPGQGAKFQVLVPVADDVVAPANANPVVATTPAAGRGRGRIMVVDDEPTVGRFIAELLELEGYTADVEADASQALERLGDHDALDLVISDQTMPGLTGAEFVRRSRERRPGLPVILMSGYSASVDAHAARSIGAFEFLAKPIDPDILLDAVARAFEAQASP
ncbi:MAG: PAS domain-containing protein [Gammaproteobacteria bacterium]